VCDSLSGEQVIEPFPAISALVKRVDETDWHNNSKQDNLAFQLFSSVCPGSRHANIMVKVKG
jgi:hypothetical protein